MTDGIINVAVCSACPLGQTAFTNELRRKLDATHGSVVVKTRECMSGCARPSTLSVRAPGKTAYLFGDLATSDIPLIIDFLGHYRVSVTGDFADARVLGDLRFKALARIPG